MPYTSKHGDAFVPNVTLTDYVLARADAAPAGATAFTDGPSGRAVAYSSLRAHALTTYHLPPPPATYHLPPTTYHLPPITYRLLGY